MTVDKANFQIPSYYSTIQTTSFVNNRNLYGKDFKQLAYNTNYIAGNGGVSLPLTSFIFNFGNPSRTSASLRLLMTNPASCRTRNWEFDFFASSNNLFSIDISSSGNGLFPNRFASNGSLNRIEVTESNLNISDITGQPSISDTNIVFSSTASLATLYHLSAFNQPAAYLNPTTQQSDHAVDVNSCGPNIPVFSAPYNENSSIGGIAKQIDIFANTAIKPIYAWATPYKVAGTTNWNNTIPINQLPWYVTGSTRTNVYTLNDNCTPFVFATTKDTTVLSKTCSFYAYAAVQTAGNVGRIEVTSSLGTGFITVGSTTPSWVSGSIEIPCEMLSTYGTNPVHPNMVNALTGNLSINIRKQTNIDATAFSVWTFQIIELF